MFKFDISRYLKEHKVTCTDLAQRLGKTTANVSSMLRTNITINRAIDVANALGCDIIDFQYNEDGMSVADYFRDKYAHAIPAPIEEPVREHTEEPANDKKEPTEPLASVPQQLPFQPENTIICPRCGTKFMLLN